MLLDQKTGSNAKVKAVKLIIDSILNKNLTPQKQVLALREALLHIQVRIVAKSAGVIDNSLFDVYEHIINNISKVLSLARKTVAAAVINANRFAKAINRSGCID